MSAYTERFIKQMKDPLKYKLFLFAKLPAAYLAGVRIREIDAQHCVTSVPYKWLSQNPFRSTYFACLSMAAELSTGALAMAHLYRSDPPVSMLVTKVESEYYKKATGRTWFRCVNGDDFKKAIEEAISSGEPRQVVAESVGKNPEGEIVARFLVTWSFKAKPSKP